MGVSRIKLSLFKFCFYAPVVLFSHSLEHKRRRLAITTSFRQCHSLDKGFLPGKEHEALASHSNKKGALEFRCQIKRRSRFFSRVNFIVDGNPEMKRIKRKNTPMSEDLEARTAKNGCIS
jgi:hypothetical protein